MTVMVTGGAGYIGSHVCVELYNEGYDLLVIDNFSTSKPKVMDKISKIVGNEIPYMNLDINDREGLEKVFLEYEIEAVIHLAGFKAVGESVANPLAYYKNNVCGTIVLCDLLEKHGVQKIVFSSSATVYGYPDKVPITEESALMPTNPYGRTKMMIEQVLEDLHASNPEWSIINLRYFNPIGAHDSGEIGEDPQGIPNNLVPYITQVAIGKLERLKVFGGDYSTKDGTGVRDYIHVVDLAKGHVLALTKVMGSSGINTYNLGTGKGYSVLEMIQAFEETTSRKIPYQIVSRRPGDIAVSFSDPHKANIELGWKAEKELLEMCIDAWNWQMKNPRGFHE